VKKTRSRSSNPENENYKCLKNLQNNRWSSWRQIPSKEELLQRVIPPTMYLQSSYLLEYMMAANHTLFEESSDSTSMLTISNR